MRRVLLILLALTTWQQAFAQEMVGPILYKDFGRNQEQDIQSVSKATALSLPFFEDFTDTAAYVSSLRWQATAQVYVNNSMPVNVRSRGVATFDAISAAGLPYDTLTPANSRYGDTLTSLPLDLSNVSPADSVYLSFLLQPQGNGFYPEPQDSFVVFYKTKSGFWRKIWQQAGSPLTNFKAVILPITDTQYLHDNFQFRFCNKISINSNDDVWNLDYVRIDRNRNRADTVLADIAFTSPISNFLNDYTSMPYRHFITNPSSYRSTNLFTFIQNNSVNNTSITGFFKAVAYPSNTPLFTQNLGNTSIPAMGIQTLSVPIYTATIPSAGVHQAVVFENTFYVQATSNNASKANDTIVQRQVFDNYLAYDDGSAEKSYYLNLFSTLPGKIAIEFAIPQPDTLRGVAIYFGRQSPLARNKRFNLQVYKSIAYMGATEQLLAQEFDLSPAYDSVDHFWYYTFSQPIILPAGQFFIGTMQPAFSGADSLYFGLDVNRQGGNHVYYNVLNQWESSTVSGAVMMRPLLGQKVVPSSIKSVEEKVAAFQIYPNPATSQITLVSSVVNLNANYEIANLAGQILQSGSFTSSPINIQHLPVGMYFIKLQTDGKIPSILTFNKL